MGVDEAFEAELAVARLAVLEREAGMWRRYSPFTEMDDGRIFCDACMRPWQWLSGPDTCCPGCGLTEADIKPQALGISPPTAKTLTSEG